MPASGRRTLQHDEEWPEQRHDGELSQLDAEIEAEECAGEAIRRQCHLRQDPGEAESVHQTEREGEHDAVWAGVASACQEREVAGLQGPGAMFMLGTVFLLSTPAVLVVGLVLAAIVLTLFGLAIAGVLAAVALVVAAWIVRTRRIGEEEKAAQQDRLRKT